MIIGLVGNEHVGKDTIANYLYKEYNFRKYNLADPIKEISKKLFGWSDNKLNGKLKDKIDKETGIIPRDFFKWFGTEIFQYSIHNKFPNLKINNRCMWANCMKQFIEIYGNNSNIVITDIRFIHEADILIKSGGLLIHINRNSISSDNYEINTLIKNINPYNNKPWIFDKIDNNGTYDDLYKKIQKIINNMTHL